uniref:Uncharacterized protein n=1 Tax=Glossina palpalis gambiensis TaxID=67801 RepID=A0A1B0BGY0_9MUSC
MRMENGKPESATPLPMENSPCATMAPSTYRVKETEIVLNEYQIFGDLPFPRHDHNYVIYNLYIR